MLRSPFTVAVALALTLALPGRARAQEAVPPQLSLVVMLKVLTYDTGFAGRGAQEFVVLVVHGPGQEQALADAEAAIKAMAQTRIEARALRFVTVTESALAQSAKDQRASAVLVLPGASQAQLSSVANLAELLRLYTLSLDPAFVQSKVALAVVNNSGRPQPAINLALAKSLGINLPTSLLKVVRTYQ